MSKKDNFKPCYYIHGNADFQDYLENELEVLKCDFSANGYRLPTEAEWEYAARGGKKSEGYKYAGSDDIDKVAWYVENSGDRTHPVGKKRHNELGIYDMSGNVFEWCWDWYDADYYSSSPQTNPKGPNGSDYRVLRGGSYYHYDLFCRVATRNYINPDYSRAYGFRFVRAH